jgi:hypothetical protein
MNEEPGALAVEKKLQQRFASGEIEIESAIHELELSHTAMEKFLKIFEQCRQRKLANRNIERRKAKLASERAATRRLDVDDAVSDVFVVVEFVRRRELRKVGQFGGDDFRGEFFPGEQTAAHLGEFQVSLAGDDVIGCANDRLTITLETDFGSAKNNDQVRAKLFKQRDEFGGRCDIPDVNTKAEDFGIFGKERLGDFGDRLVDIEFQQSGARTKFAEIRQQISQAESGMDVFCIQRCEDNLGHAGTIAAKQGDEQSEDSERDTLEALLWQVNGARFDNSENL